MAWTDFSTRASTGWFFPSTAIRASCLMHGCCVCPPLTCGGESETTQVSIHPDKTGHRWTFQGSNVFDWGCPHWAGRSHQPDWSTLFPVPDACFLVIVETAVLKLWRLRSPGRRTPWSRGFMNTPTGRALPRRREGQIMRLRVMIRASGPCRQGGVGERRDLSRMRAEARLVTASHHSVWVQVARMPGSPG